MSTLIIALRNILVIKSIYVVHVVKENVDHVSNATRFVLNLMKDYVKDFFMLHILVMDVITKLVVGLQNISTKLCLLLILTELLFQNQDKVLICQS